LGRCRREVKGVLTVSDVVSRIEDGRPGVEQAWSMLPITESQTAVWTDEMAAAFGACEALIVAATWLQRAWRSRKPICAK
jgi:hypothetical protein